jgi:hypothetical protein
MYYENPMVGSAYSYPCPYKPKQHFAYYNNDNQPIYHTFEIDQPARKSFKHDHHYPLSPLMSQKNDEELLSLLDIKTEGNLNEKPRRTVSLFKDKHRNIACAICGDISSGFHYGVYSCEGCKVKIRYFLEFLGRFVFFCRLQQGFFRRSLHQDTSYLCKNSNNCEITLSNRNSCQSCRLKKCIDIGMSRDGSRLGRPRKRSHSEMISMHNNSTNSNDHSLEPIISKRSKLIFPQCLFRDHQNLFVPNIHQEVQRKLLSMLIYQERLLTHIEVKELDHLKDMIINAHRQFCPNTIEKIQIQIKKNPPVLANSIVRLKTMRLLFYNSFLFLVR